MFNIIAGHKCIYTDIHIVKLYLCYKNKTYKALLRTTAVVIGSKSIGLFLFGDHNLPKRFTDLTMSTSYTACGSKKYGNCCYVCRSIPPESSMPKTGLFRLKVIIRICYFSTVSSEHRHGNEGWRGSYPWNFLGGRHDFCLPPPQ